LNDSKLKTVEWPKTTILTSEPGSQQWHFVGNITS
jgi:hypothetical protein